jgi:hypothetical protein
MIDIRRLIRGCNQFDIRGKANERGSQRQSNKARPSNIVDARRPRVTRRDVRHSLETHSSRTSASFSQNERLSPQFSDLSQSPHEISSLTQIGPSVYHLLKYKSLDIPAMKRIDNPMDNNLQSRSR